MDQKAAGVERFPLHGIGHEPRNAAISIQKWVNPEQAMVGAGRGDDCVGLAEFCIGFLEAGEEARQGAWADRHTAAGGARRVTIARGINSLIIGGMRSETTTSNPESPKCQPIREVESG